MPANALGLALRLVVSAILLVAGVAKLFATKQSDYELLSAIGLRDSRAFRVAASLTPFVEILLAIHLPLTRSPMLPLVVAEILLLIFFGVAAYALFRGYKGRCNCFGPLANSRLGVSHLIFNLLLILFGATAILVEATPMISLNVFDATSEILTLSACIAALTIAAKQFLQQVETVHQLYGNQELQ